jgi:RNA polymerase primary sigma factor
MAGITLKDSQALDLYFRDLNGSRTLTREEEVALMRQVRKGDRNAKEKLILANLRFVVRIAREYMNRGVPLGELISAGNLGLLIAAERFDETRGFKFISYAVWWIRQAILEALAHDGRLVRLPASRLLLLNKIARASNESMQAQEAKPVDDLLAEQLGITVEALRETLMQAQPVRSLDATLGEDDGRTLADGLSDPNLLPNDAGVEDDSVRKQIQRAMSILDERETEILRMYYGLDGSEPLTLEQIGDRFSLTRERIRQIKERALTRLRQSSYRHSLKGLLE